MCVLSNKLGNGHNKKNSKIKEINVDFTVLGIDGSNNNYKYNRKWKK